jgi:hypothetical protein
MAMKIQVAVFWVVPPCSDVVGYHFRGPCSLHLHFDEGGSKALQNVSRRSWLEEGIN